MEPHVRLSLIRCWIISGSVCSQNSYETNGEVFQVDLIEEHCRGTIKRTSQPSDIREHPPPALTQSIISASLWPFSILSPVLIYLMFFLPSPSETFSFSSVTVHWVQNGTSSTRVDRAAGRLCHMSTLEPQLCFDSQKHSSLCFLFHSFSILASLL